MGKYIFILCTIFILACGRSQSESSDKRIVGGPCEGCEAALEYGDKKLIAEATLPGHKANEPKLKITGTIYDPDGKTPASGVILYAYHTNRKGIYETKGDEKGWAKRHGFIRGWVKTGDDGKYTFYTFRPASYPNRAAPEHIHLTVKEPDKNPYYIDDIMFDDDPLLTEGQRKDLKKRGGPGIVMVADGNGMGHVKRDIVLGLNIPDYE